MRPAASILRKVSLAIFAATALALASVAAAIWVFEYRATDLRARATLESLAETMAPGLVASVDFGTADVATEHLRRLQSGRIVVAATVFRTPGAGEPPQLFATYLRPGAHPAFPPQPRPASFIRHADRALLTHIIRTDGSPAAILQLEADVGPFRRSLYESLVILGLVLAVLGLAAVFLGRLLQNALTRPLLRLAAIVERIRKTGDYTARAAFPQRDEIGRLAEGFDLMLDGIEERDRRLAEHSALQHAVLESAGVPILSTTPDDIVRTFNTASEQMLGYRREEIVGRCTLERFFDPAEIGQRAREHSRQLGRELPGGLAYFHELARREAPGIELTCIRKDGSRIPVVLVLSALRTPDGRNLGLCGIVTDLTERKAAEHAVRDSEERMRQSFEASPIGLALLDDKGRVLYFNRKAVEWFGYTATEVPDIEAWWPRAYPDPSLREDCKRRWAERMAEATARGGEMQPMESPVTCRDGRQRLIEFRSQQYSGKTLIAFTDITQRRAAEEAVRTSEERFRIVAEQTGQMISDRNLVNDTTIWAGATHALIGYSPEELGSYPPAWWLEQIHPDDRAKFLECYLQVKERGLSRQHEYRFRHRDGRWVCLLGTATAVLDSTGNPLRVLAATADITSRRNAEVALRASEERFRILAEQTGQLIFDQDLATSRRVWAGAATMIGYTLEELCTVPKGWWTEHVHPDDRETFSTRFSRLQQAGGSDHLIYRFRHRDGHWIYLAGIVTALADATGKPVRLLGTTADVTQQQEDAEAIRRLNTELEQRVRDRTAELARRVAEVERLNSDLHASQDDLAHAASRLQEANSNLLAANQELESFSYSVSHDLRAPLRNIAGFIELLRKRTTGQLDPEADRYFGIVGSEAVRMAALIDDLLTFSRIGRAELHFAPVQLAALVAEVQTELQSDLAGRQIEWQIQPLTPVLGDRTLLRQVVANLLSNAVKFTRRRPAATIEIGVQPAQPGSELLTFFVRDNGAGFDPKYAPKLFGVFQRLHNPRDFEGTGIGLANVRRIVERHGGRVWAEGAPDHGATFFFSLRPAAP
jgi:PAS domain S-box-containing protein